MHYSEISEQILAKGYHKTEGATPDATVNAQITGSIKNEGDKSPFVRISRGLYTLRTTPNYTSTADLGSSITPVSTKDVLAAAQIATVETEPDGSIIRCLGMYWQRELVMWKNDPRIYGKQQSRSKPVDFGAQRGIYILYDHHTVIYVGRSVDRPLGKRLYEHTMDRLGSRWNRFSWFGLHDVTDEGILVEVSLKVSLPSLIATLEALLIESLEPPQNRKRGDDFSFMEYIQDVDPEIKERELRNTLRGIEQKLRE